MNKKKKILIAIPVIAGGIAAAVLLLSGPRMRNQPNLRAFETTVNLPPEGSVFYTPRTYQKTNQHEIPPTSENLEKGKIYYNYYCVACHGEDGKGNGPVGRSYMPKPADLSREKIQQAETKYLLNHSFSGTGHEPVLEKVVPMEFRSYIVIYVKTRF